jgi:hypothetical protein
MMMALRDPKKEQREVDLFLPQTISKKGENLSRRVGDLRVGSGEMPEHNHREQLHTWDIW